MYFKKPVQFYLDVGALIRGLFDPQVGYGLLSIFFDKYKFQFDY